MDDKSRTDEALMLAIRDRSLGALEELYDRLHPVALAVALRVLEDRSLAEDATQEAFLAIWRQPESFRPERGTARNWLLSIVRHRAIDVARGRQRRRDRTSLDDIILEPQHPDAWQQVSMRLDSETVKAALDDLPEEQRETVMLSYFGGHTLKEISEKTGVPLGTAKGRMRLALSKLRILLADADMGASD